MADQHSVQQEASQRIPLVLGNWKMHGNLASNAALLTTLRTKTVLSSTHETVLSSTPGDVVNPPKVTPSKNGHIEVASPRKNCEVGVCVPFPYLAQAQALLQGSLISWGAQDISAQEKGAYTGEVSGAMLAELGARWVLVGHSERRMMHSEHDELVVAKAKAALAAGLTPVICVGETEAEYKAGKTLAVVHRQLAPVLRLEVQALARIVVAYEPIWAIGRGGAATPDQAQKVHHAIRVALRASGVPQVRILYGGSVNASNAADLCVMADIDGVLVGSASRVVDEFLHIVECCGLCSE